MFEVWYRVGRGYLEAIPHSDGIGYPHSRAWDEACGGGRDEGLTKVGVIDHAGRNELRCQGMSRRRC